MSDETTAQSAALPPPLDVSVARSDGADIEVKKASIALSTENVVNENAAASEIKDTNGAEFKHAAQKSSDTELDDTTSGMDTKIDTDAKEGEGSPIAIIGDPDPATATPASAGKFKARRKSGGVPEHKNKKLNKKASKIKMSHSDAKPGDYFFIRLKGYPLWPGIVCDESMLPQSLITTRPVTAARADGTYRVDYEDGGKKVHERTFPVMYLYTNEFGWIPNYDLVDLDLEEVGKVDAKMRKDLYQAHQLAAEKYDLEHYKQVLIDFEAQRAAEAEAKAAAKAAKEAQKSSGKSKKKTKASTDIADGENEDVEMVDAEGQQLVSEGAGEKKPKVSKKRKAATDAEDQSTPQVSSSAKKLKFKPIASSTPKTANGATPKSTGKKDSASKPSKSKPKKSTANGSVENVTLATPKEPELSPEEKRVKKEKEILFLRHKLQKGLLTRDQQPKEDEMKQMSEFISKLEGYADLEVSIIRATKINKVLKAILKLAEIPKEAEFQFKDRSKSLLEKWNKILESAEQPNTIPGSIITEGHESSSKELTNGVSAPVHTDQKVVNGEEKEQKTEQPAATSDVKIITTDIDAKKEPVEERQPANDSIKLSTAEAVAV